MSFPSYPGCPQGSQDPVFDTIKCNVPCIFPITGDPWIDDDTVVDPPADINDCPLLPPALPPPEIPCPEIGIDTDCF